MLCLIRRGPYAGPPYLARTTMSDAAAPQDPEVPSDAGATETDAEPDRAPANDEPDATRRRRWRPRRLHWHLSFWSVVTAGLATLFVFLASMSVTGRVIVLPDWVTAQVLARLDAAVPSGSFTLRHVEFGVTPAGRPRLRLVDVGIRDATGLELAQLNGVEGGFRLRAALTGHLEPTVLRLDGAQITLRRLADGSFAIQFGSGVGATASLGTALDTLDAAFAEGPLASTSRLEASDLTITLEDARSGRIWQVTDGKLEVVPGQMVIDTSVSFDVFNGTENLAAVQFAFRSARDSSEASLSARFSNAAAADIAAQTPALAFLSVLDAPISGALRSTIGVDGAISGLSGTLEIGAGALSPTPGATPAAFNGAKVYIDFDAAQQRLDFQSASLSSELVTAKANGQIFLTDFQGGWPNSLVTQVTLDSARLAPRDLFAAPLDIDGGSADIRVRLDPFRIDIGQAVLFRGERRYAVSGSLAAGKAGWTIALDGEADRADIGEVMALWPLGAAPGARKWVADHVSAADAVGAALAFRKRPGGRLAMDGTIGIENGNVRVIDTLPPVDIARGYVTLGPGTFTTVADMAHTAAPGGGVLDLSGTSFQIADTRVHPQTGAVELALKGPLRATLELLDRKPFNIFGTGRFGPDVARGQIAATGKITLPLLDHPIPREDIHYDMRAELTGVSSDQLIEKKLLVGDRLALRAAENGVEISGPVQVGQARASGSWHLPMAAGKPGEPDISGTLTLDAAGLREFGLGALEPMVGGATRAYFSIALPKGETPRLTLRSDLAGLAMKIPGTGWSKPAATTAKLELAATLGDRPEVESLSLDAPGLSATGAVTTAEGGGLGEAKFSRVRIGGWLDAPVVITGRGAHAPVAITIPGGWIDMRKANLDSGPGGGGQAGPRQPLTLALDRLIISEGIQLRNLRADLDLSGGLHGTFAGRIAGGKGARIKGTVAQSDKGAAFRITSKDAGGVLMGANIFQTARGGDLELILAPVGQTGTYEGEFTITDTRVVNAPTMAELLSAVSIVGLLDQLGGEGISFTKVEGRFRLDPKSVTLYRSSAVGPSMGISLDGYYDLTAGQIDMQGVLSPLYLLNSLGRLLSPREGEGLVGFNFTLTGNFDKPKVEVNPLSVLTPGAFREIFRRPPPSQPGDTTSPDTKAAPQQK